MTDDDIAVLTREVHDDIKRAIRDVLDGKNAPAGDGGAPDDTTVTRREPTKREVA